MRGRHRSHTLQGKGPAGRQSTLAGDPQQSGIGARFGNLGVSRSGGDDDGGGASSTAGQPIGLLLILTKAS